MSPLRDGGGHYRLRLGLHTTQVLGAAITLGVDLVDILGAGRSRGEPPAIGHHLQSTDRRAVPRRLREDRLYLPARELLRLHLLGLEVREQLLLRRRRGRVDTLEQRLAERTRELAIRLAGITSRARRHLGRQQGRRDAVLVRRPHAAVLAQERCARAFLADESERPVEQAIDEPLEA